MELKTTLLMPKTNFEMRGNLNVRTTAKRKHRRRGYTHNRRGNPFRRPRRRCCADNNPEQEESKGK